MALAGGILRVLTSARVCVVRVWCVLSMFFNNKPLWLSMCYRDRARLHASREEFPDWDLTRYAEGIWLRFKVQSKVGMKGNKKSLFVVLVRDGVDVGALQPGLLSRVDEVCMC